MVLEGIGRSLDPELDILSAAKPFLFKKTVKSLFKNQ
jgi:predicted unusual protein kinase regulating ubiquinone biosynthesis (AarF/ABC1/UbiB family)